MGFEHWEVGFGKKVGWEMGLVPPLQDPLTKQGNLRVEIHFGQALPNTVNLIIYAEFQNVIEIDASRNVLYDYTS